MRIWRPLLAFVQAMATIRFSSLKAGRVQTTSVGFLIRRAADATSAVDMTRPAATSARPRATAARSSSVSGSSSSGAVNRE